MSIMNCRVFVTWCSLNSSEISPDKLRSVAENLLVVLLASNSKLGTFLVIAGYFIDSSYL